MDRRQDLIDAATSLLDEGGPDAVTLREVGRRAGVSHNAPYRHFADKAELLAAIAARELSQAPVPSSGEIRSAAGDIEQFVLRYVRWALAYPERFRLTFGRWEREHPVLTMAAQRAHAGLVAAVEAGQARGRLPAGPPERLASLLLATAHGAASLALTGHLAAEGKGKADAEDLVKDLFAQLGRSARGAARQNR